MASRVNSPRGSDIYRLNDLAKTLEGRQKATILKYPLASHPDSPARGGVEREKEQCGATTFVGRPDAAYGSQTSEGRRRLGYVIGLVSSTPRRPCRVLQSASNFARERARGCFGGQVYVFSQIVDHMNLLREFRASSLRVRPGTAG